MNTRKTAKTLISTIEGIEIHSSTAGQSGIHSCGFFGTKITSKPFIAFIQEKHIPVELKHLLVSSSFACELAYTDHAAEAAWIAGWATSTPERMEWALKNLHAKPAELRTRAICPLDIPAEVRELPSMTVEAAAAMVTAKKTKTAKKKAKKVPTKIEAASAISAAKNKAVKDQRAAFVANMPAWLRDLQS